MNDFALLGHFLGWLIVGLEITVMVGYILSSWED